MGSTSRWRVASPPPARASGSHSRIRHQDFCSTSRTSAGCVRRRFIEYVHRLNGFADYLKRLGVKSLTELSPALLASFVVDTAPRLARTGKRDLCGIIRVFLRFCYRQQVIAKDLSGAVEMPQAYRLADVPRSITWDEVRRMLEAVDRRTALGRRNYAILLLLVTYGLRAHEVAKLTLDDIDWKRERWQIPERKAGHWTAYPLANVVAEALIRILRSGRPQTQDRHVFFRVLAPHSPITNGSVSATVAAYLRKAGVQVRRPGAHTLRHTCVQRLIDAEFPLKTIGDYVGHRSPQSTEIYSKVAIAALHERLLWATGRNYEGGGEFAQRVGGTDPPLCGVQAGTNRKYRPEAAALRLFDEYLCEHAATGWNSVDSVLIESFLQSRPRSRPRSYNHLLGVLHRFCNGPFCRGWSRAIR